MDEKNSKAPTSEHQRHSRISQHAVTETKPAEPGVTVDMETLMGFQKSQWSHPLITNNRSGHQRRGDFRSLFRGQGMAFSEVRPYEPGDDVRTIDWRVTARRGGQPHTKLFEEERERPVFLVVDQREHLFFGSQRCFKSVLACELAALLAWQAYAAGDRISQLIFDDHTVRRQRAVSGKRGVLMALRALVNANQALYQRWHAPPSTSQETHSQMKMANTQETPHSRETLTRTLETLVHVVKPGSHVFIVSDYLGFDPDNTPLAQSLRHLSQHCDIYTIFIYDLLEAALPAAGILRFSDSQQVLDVNTNSTTTRTAFHEQFSNRVKRIEQCFENCSIKTLLRGTHQITNLNILSLLHHTAWRQDDISASWRMLQRVATDWQGVLRELSQAGGSSWRTADA